MPCSGASERDTERNRDVFQYKEKQPTTRRIPWAGEQERKELREGVKQTRLQLIRFFLFFPFSSLFSLFSRVLCCCCSVRRRPFTVHVEKYPRFAPHRAPINYCDQFTIIPSTIHNADWICMNARRSALIVSMCLLFTCTRWYTTRPHNAHTGQASQK